MATFHSNTDPAHVFDLLAAMLHDAKGSITISREAIAWIEQLRATDATVGFRTTAPDAGGMTVHLVNPCPAKVGNDSGLPTWGELPEKVRGKLVTFFRTAELEVSFAYAAENFPPDFPDTSPLADVDPAVLRDTYWSNYKALPLDEFWRLYELA